MQRKQKRLGVILNSFDLKNIAMLVEMRRGQFKLYEKTATQKGQNELQLTQNM